MVAYEMELKLSFTKAEIKLKEAQIKEIQILEVEARCSHDVPKQLAFFRLSEDNEFMTETY